MPLTQTTLFQHSANTSQLTTTGVLLLASNLMHCYVNNIFVLGQIVATIWIFIFIQKYKYFKYEYLVIAYIQFLQNLNQKSCHACCFCCETV